MNRIHNGPLQNSRISVKTLQLALAEKKYGWELCCVSAECLTCLNLVPAMEPETSIRKVMCLGVYCRSEGAKKCTKYPSST